MLIHLAELDMGKDFRKLGSTLEYYQTQVAGSSFEKLVVSLLITSLKI